MRILVIDDHGLFRAGLALLLQQLQSNVVVIEAESCEQALTLSNQHLKSFELILLDVFLPGMFGLDGIAPLRERYRDARIVAVSSSEDPDLMLRALDLGALGYIPKTTSSKIMFDAVRLVLDGGIYLPPAILAVLSRRGLSLSKNSVAITPGRKQPTQPGLSPREIQVLYLLMQGRSGKEIALELTLSLNTVKSHTSAILRALNVTTRTQAVVAASRLGLRFAGDVL